MLDDLIELLIMLKLKPRSGHGQTVIIWKEGEVFLIQCREDIKPSKIN